MAAESEFCATNVPGLYYCSNFLTAREEEQLLSGIHKETWKENRNKTRKIQIYGPYHDERYRVYQNGEVTPWPQFLVTLANSIQEIVWTHLSQFNVTILPIERKTEIFINQYVPGNALDFHFDHKHTYREMIIGVSLKGSTNFSFKNSKTEEIRSVLLERRSIYFMTGDSRLVWQHGLEKNNVKQERISITYRMINPKAVLKR